MRESLRPKPQALLFNFKPEPRTLQLARFLSSLGVAVRQVPEAEQHFTLGALFSLPGCESKAGISGASFREEMLVLGGFDQPMLDALLDFFKSSGLRRVSLKAILTPTNAAWSAERLFRELSAERAALRGRNG